MNSDGLTLRADLKKTHPGKSGITRQEAKSIFRSQDSMPSAKACKKADCSIADVIDDYRSLIKVVADIRKEFGINESNALKISEVQEYKTKVSRKRKKSAKNKNSPKLKYIYLIKVFVIPFKSQYYFLF